METPKCYWVGSRSPPLTGRELPFPPVHNPVDRGSYPRINTTALGQVSRINTTAFTNKHYRLPPANPVLALAYGPLPICPLS
jgi:hypothetical protein